ncbi:MAG: ABC transporter permease [Phycisphaerales bacterium]
MSAALIKYRGFIWKRALLDLRVRYATTDLGILWNILHPLALIGTYTFVFSFVMGARYPSGSVPYWVFICSGLVPWMAFSDCVTSGATCFQVSAPYLRKLPVPEEVFIAERALSATINLALSFAVLIAAALIVGQPPRWHWALIPVALVMLQMVGFGFGLALGTITTFFPDVRQLIPMTLRMAMWLAPVLYPMSRVPARVHGIVRFHPGTPFLIAVHELFLEGKLPENWVWWASGAWVIGSLVVGTLVLRALRKEIRDVL